MSHILDDIQPNVVHVHEPAVPAVAAAATLTAKVPVVGTFHAAGNASEYYGRFLPLGRRIVKCLAVRIAVSEAARQCVAGYFPGVYRIIPNGIEISNFVRARSEPKMPGRVLFVGRPEPRKGLDVLLRAFVGLARELPQASLVLVGPTPDELRSVARAVCGSSDGALERVQALGYVSEEEKVLQVGKAEVFCAPSLFGESFGIVLLEAMAGGLPVVASDLAGYRAVLRGGRAGLLVPPGNPLALQDALRKLLTNSHLRISLSSAGISIAEEYSWERLVHDVVSAYEEAVALGPCRVAETRVPLGDQIRYTLRNPRTLSSVFGLIAANKPSSWKAKKQLD